MKIWSKWYYHCPTCYKRFKKTKTQQIHAKIWSKNEFSNVIFCDKTSKNICTTQRHIKILSKNYLITVQHVIRGSRTKAPRENTQRFDPRIILILILLADKLSRSLKGGFQQCHTCDITSKNSCTTWRHMMILSKNDIPSLENKFQAVVKQILRTLEAAL